VIWNDKIIHTCPFNHITDTWLESEENVLHNQQKFLLFEPKEKVNFCDSELILTQEGIYLQKMQIGVKPLVEADTDHKDEGALADLQLSDIDFHSFYTMKRYLAIKRLACNNLISTLQIAKLMVKRFSTIYSEDGTPTIIFSTGSNIIFPSCIKVSEIDIKEETYKCYREIPVKFNLNNETKFGFLTNNNVIKISSERIDCEIIKASIVITSPLIILNRVGNRTTLTEQTDERLIDINIKIDDLNDINYHHSNLIKDGLLSSQLKLGLEMVKENDGTYMVLPEQQFEVNTIAKTFSLRELGIKFGWGSSILISIVLIIVITYCCVSPVIANYMSNKWRKIKTTKWTNVKFLNSSDPTVHLETVPLQDIESIPSSNPPRTPLSPFAMLIKNLTSGKPMAPTTELETPKLTRQHSS